ncbi:hypothetical protein L7F22_014126 [Adiantum nelumboides]|nr:hypothetical protein [Adiantum nelumboides]
MAVSFPTFYGHHDDNARDFMDSLEMAHLMAGRDQEEVKLRAFPLVLKGEARVWYDALAPPSKATWSALYGAFLNKYGQRDTPENLWKQLLRHRQSSLGDYNTYESKFTNLWERWAASLQGQGGAPNFLKRDKFVEGMFPTLKEKVEAKFPQTFEEAQEIATVKFKKLLYQERKSNCVKEREEVNVPQHTNNAQPKVAPISADSHQEDLLHKLTQQLETLTLNLVQAPTRGQQPRDDARPLRRSTQEYNPVLGSPLTQVARVLVAALQNSRRGPLDEHCALYEGDEIDRAKLGKVRMLHTNQFRCLDKAAMVPKKEKFEHATQGMSRWRVCSVTEVEEVKLIVRTLPIWLSLIPFSLATTQTHSLFIKQGSTLDRRVGNIKIPPASVAVFLTLTMVLFLPLYDRLLVPLMRKFTHNERGITLLQKIGVGTFIAVVGMATAALVKKKRLNLAGGRPQSKEVHMSIFWLLPQYALLGLAQSFTSIGRLEFFYEQVPNSLRSLGTSMYLSSVGVANFLSSALIAIINRSTKPHPWIGRNLNTSHVDYFYWLLSALCFFELWVFIGLSFWYRYKPTPSS